VDPAGGETGIPHCLAEVRISCKQRRHFALKDRALTPILPGYR
jgi:hypothetical protein